MRGLGVNGHLEQMHGPINIRSVCHVQVFHIGFEVCPLCTGVCCKEMQPRSECDYTIRLCRNKNTRSCNTVPHIPWPSHCGVSLRKRISYFTNEGSPSFFNFLLILILVSLQISDLRSPCLLLLQYPMIPGHVPLPI